MADYVFFPLSHIFGESKKLPSRLLELSLACLRLLILHGWRHTLSSEIGKQLLILLAFIAGDSATDSRSKDVHEDVGTIAFDCTTSLFNSSVASFLGNDNAISPENTPLLGHAVTVILDGISNGPAVRVRLAAASSLEALVSNVQDYESIQNFFPGIVSCLTKVLASGIKSKTSYKVLEACMHNLDQIICKIFSDDVLQSSKSERESSKGDEKASKGWKEATSSQVKIALSAIVPLRYHERQEIQDALFSFCISILTRCRKSLTNCAAMMLETLVILSSDTSSRESAQRRGKLKQVLAADPELIDLIREALYDWIVALPRAIGSNDGTKQTRILQQLSTAVNLLSIQNVDLNALNHLMATNLQSSVATVVQLSANGTIRSLPDDSADVGRILQYAAVSKNTPDFTSILSGAGGRNAVAAGLQILVQHLQDSPMSTALKQCLADSLRVTSGHEQIGSLWLILQMSGHTLLRRHETDQWLTIASDGIDQMKEEAYAFALEVLDNSAYDDTFDWRLQALSLETVALQARSQATDFRPELVDALYPILERMGSSNAALQQHAVTCLSVVSNACGYSSASELVIDNADYLVNAVAVKLNTFDISPQASQVMLMMVRLCGADLIPYLDDLIESIFAILACYHGYPRLVESLFEVLNAIVEEGGKTSSLAIESDKVPTQHRRQPYKPISIADLNTRLQDIQTKASKPDSPPLSPPPETADATSPPPSKPNEPPPLSKTHSLIQTITLQTTHHLSTPSPTLRRLLLTLLTSSLPTLATQTPHDSFLPLLAKVYPHITSTLFSSPPSTNSSSAHTTPSSPTNSNLPTLLAALTCLSTTLTSGGDFLLSRTEDDFPRLLALSKTLEQAFLAEEKQIGPSRASRSLKYKCWDACVGVVVSMVEYVGVTREMEDGVFEVMGGEALRRGRGGVRDCLEGVNPDGVWLLKEIGRRDGEGESGLGEERWKKPVVEGWEFKDVHF